MTDLKPLFNDLVRFETDLWNGIDAVLRETAGVSLGNLDVLRVIERVENCRVQDIAGELAITVGGASQAVDRAVAAGTAVRGANPSDRRSSIVELSPTGRETVARGIIVFEDELDARVGSTLDRASVEQLARILRTLRSSQVPAARTSR